MINSKDNLGNELSKEQIEYFKNTKIVDKNNNLLVVYHGSPTPNFKEFNPKDNKSQFGKYKFGDHNVNYFTTDKRSAASYTEFGYDDGTLFECYINIVNPYIVDNKSEAEIKSHLNIKDDRLRQQQINLFDRIFNKWKGKILDYSDYRFNELNNDLHKLNLELRPSDQYEEDTDPMDIEYFDLWNLGRNSFIGAEHILEYQYSTDELFDDDMYDQLKEDIIGEDPNDYYFSTDDIVRFVLSLDENYDGIIIKDIHDSKDMFSDITTDIITLSSPNQIKSISNKNPSSSNRIDETLIPYISDRYLLWKGPEYSKEPKTDKIRLYHQTMKDNIPSIIKNGLQGKFKRWYDNPGGNVIWASSDQPTDSSHWNYGNCVFELDLPKDFDMRMVNSSDYNIYEDIPVEYINALYLKTPYVPFIMQDFQNTLDIDKSIDNYDKYRKGELKENLNEQLLLEVSRRDLINKSKKGKDYSKKNQALGRNRWERKKWSRVANSTREFNSIDMNTFFKKDILIVNVPVNGETDNYIVKIKFEGVLKEIQKNVQANNNKLDYRTISQSLSRVFNGGDVYCNCSCPDWKFRMAHWSTVQGYNSGKPEDRPNRFTWTNSNDDMGGICKHASLVLSNLSWMMKVASVINNYIHYAETYMQRQFADIIFPKIYGVKYPDALQLGMFDRQYLKHSKGVIDAINEFGGTRCRFKKKKPTEPTNPNEVEVRTSPKQISIFDKQDDEEQEEIVDEQGNKGFRQYSIFDYGIGSSEKDYEVEEKPKGFKPKREQPKIQNKGFKKLSLFDDEESEE